MALGTYWCVMSRRGKTFWGNPAFRPAGQFSCELDLKEGMSYTVRAAFFHGVRQAKGDQANADDYRMDVYASAGDAEPLLPGYDGSIWPHHDGLKWLHSVANWTVRSGPVKSGSEKEEQIRSGARSRRHSRPADRGGADSSRPSGASASRHSQLPQFTVPEPAAAYLPTGQLADYGEDELLGELARRLRSRA